MNITNWKYILEAYNLEKQVHYKNIGLLLLNLYRKTKSTSRMDKILGVAETTIMKKLKSYRYPIQKKGGDYLSRAPKKRKFLAISDDKLRRMSIDEIMESVGCSETHTHYLLKQKFEDYPNCYIKRLGFPQRRIK